MCPPIISSKVPLQALATEEVPETEPQWVSPNKYKTTPKLAPTHRSRRTEWGSTRWWRPRSLPQSRSCTGKQSRSWERAPQTRRNTGRPWQRPERRSGRRWRYWGRSHPSPPHQLTHILQRPECCPLLGRWGQRFPGNGTAWSLQGYSGPPLSSVLATGRTTQPAPAYWHLQRDGILNLLGQTVGTSTFTTEIWGFHNNIVKIYTPSTSVLLKYGKKQMRMLLKYKLIDILMSVWGTNLVWVLFFFPELLLLWQGQKGKWCGTKRMFVGDRDHTVQTQ